MRLLRFSCLKLLGTLLLLSPIIAADPLIGACAKNAAHPDDAGNLGRGVSFGHILGEVAKSICLKAYQEHPTNGLVNTALSRAYNKLEQYDASFKHASIAVQSGYPFGDYVVAMHYSFGDGVPKSDREANKWLLKASDKGVAIASIALADNLLNGEGVEKNLTLASQRIDMAIAQGSKKAEYNKGLILEAQAEQSKLRSGDIGDYLSQLTLAYGLIEAVDYKTDIDGSKALARINKKIEQQQVDLVAMVPVISEAQRKLTQEGYPWITLPAVTQSNGQTFQASYVNVSGTVLALWHQFDKSNRTSQWYIDFDYSGSTTIDSIQRLSVHYDGEFYTDKPSKTYERIAFTEMSTRVKNNRRRAVGKVDYRAVELLMHGSDIVVHYWSEDAKSKSFTLPLNIAKHQSDSKGVIGALVSNATTLTESCCDRSNVTPFSWNYWSQRNTCEGAMYTREDRVGQFLFGPEYLRRTEEEIETKRQDFLAKCAEVRLPAEFKAFETVNVGGKEIDKELYDEFVRKAYFEQVRQQAEKQKTAPSN